MHIMYVINYSLYSREKTKENGGFKENTNYHRFHNNRIATPFYQ